LGHCCIFRLFITGCLDDKIRLVKFHNSLTEIISVQSDQVSVMFSLFHHAIVAVELDFEGFFCFNFVVWVAQYSHSQNFGVVSEGFLNR
jgi:hypothetical protein